MSMQIIETTSQDREMFANLYQFYLYDFTEFLDISLEDDGRYEEDDLIGYWERPWKHAFLLRVDSEIAGFAMVEDLRHFPDEDVIDMAEFFVMKKFRGKGVGEYLACAMFDRFPGRWRVRQIETNKPAVVFWRKVIERYTGGSFEDTTWVGNSRTGTVQYFVSGSG
jgi:predicted acetyltransferase